MCVRGKEGSGGRLSLPSMKSARERYKCPMKILDSVVCGMQALCS